MSTSKSRLLSLPAECRITMYTSLFSSIKITIRHDLLLLRRLRDTADELAPDVINSCPISPDFPLHRSLSVLLVNKVIAAEAGPLLASHITFHIQSIKYNMSRTDYLGKLSLALGPTRFSQIRYVQINHELTGSVLYGGLDRGFECHSSSSGMRSITFSRTLFRVDRFLEREIDYGKNEERYEVGVKDPMHVETKNILFPVHDGRHQTVAGSWHQCLHDPRGPLQGAYCSLLAIRQR